MVWDKIVGIVTGPIKDIFIRRMELKEARRTKQLELEDAIHQRRIELIKQGLAADAAWEVEQINNSGWKDEYVLVVLSIPLVGCFIPNVANYILTGFEILGRTPSWYQFLVVSIFAAIYGMRIWRRKMDSGP